MTVNGVPVAGVTLLPVRAITEVLGGADVWDGKTNNNLNGLAKRLATSNTVANLLEEKERPSRPAVVVVASLASGGVAVYGVGVGAAIVGDGIV